ncbi:MAG: hypothetical protein JW755_00220 [Candidatus Aminicenantes bacterium]|nr:hypothetical protein [Candidatus Aminicenantes bacterium]
MGFNQAQKKSIKNIFLSIHQEILELGKRENEDFIKLEFHIDLDNDSIQQEEHVVILNQTMCNRDLMTVQVTYFQSKDNIIKYPKDMKKISCYIKEDGLEVKESGYNEKESERLLSIILEGIRAEKKLLKLIDINQ